MLSWTSLTFTSRNFVFKKIQDVYGADIDLRDSVSDFFAGEHDARNRVVQVIRAPVDRADSIPLGSYLQPHRTRPTPEQVERVQRTEAEVERYGSTIEDLNPDIPVASAECELTPTEQHPETRILDHEGFVVPQNINRPTRPAPTRHNDEEMVIDNTRGMCQPVYSTAELLADISLESSAQDHVQSGPVTPRQLPSLFPPNPYNTVRSPSDQRGEIPTDPIQDEEEPRLGRSTLLSQESSPSQSPVILPDDNTSTDELPPDLPRSTDLHGQAGAADAGRTQRRSRSLVRQNRWALDEENTLLDALARNILDHEIYTTHFRRRTWEGVRKKIREMRAGREAQIRVKREALERKAAAATVFKDDDALFVKAIRNNWDWRRLHETRFLHKSEDSVKMHFVEVRQRLVAEDKAKATAAHSQQRYHEQTEIGETSTGPHQKFTPDEDDLLLAARFHQAEMKRVAMHYFPLRSYEQVKSRASTLYHDADRAVKKSAQGLSQSSIANQTERILDSLDEDRRQRIETKREQIQRDEKLFSADRNQEFEQKASQKRKASEEKARNDDKRLKSKQSLETLTALEDANEKRKEVEQRRLAEDLQREAAYNKKYATWYARSEANKAAGKPIPPSPVRPSGSRIGTEVVVLPQSSIQAPVAPPSSPFTTPRTEKEPDRQAMVQGNARDKTPSTRPAAAALGEIQATQAAMSGKKRQTMTPYVEIVVATKKQKTDNPTKAATVSTRKSISKAAACPLNTPPSPFKSHLASQRGEQRTFAASQPVNKASIDGPLAGAPASFSSPIHVPHKERFVNIIKNGQRQSTLNFPAAPPQPRLGALSSAGKDLPTPESRQRGSQSTPISVVSSDSDSDACPIGNGDISDEELTAAAEASSGYWQSPIGRRSTDYGDMPTEQATDSKIAVGIASSPPAPTAQSSSKPGHPLSTNKSEKRKTVISDTFEFDSQLLHESHESTQQSSVYTEIAASKTTAAAGCDLGTQPRDRDRTPVAPEQQETSRRAATESAQDTLHELMTSQKQLLSTTQRGKLSSSQGKTQESTYSTQYAGETIAPSQATSKADMPLSQESSQSSRAFQTQDPSTTLSQNRLRSLQRPYSQKATQTQDDINTQLSQATSKGNMPSSHGSSQETQAFQTQDPSTSLSQRLMREMKPPSNPKPTQQGKPSEAIAKANVPSSEEALREIGASQTQSSSTRASQRLSKTMQPAAGGRATQAKQGDNTQGAGKATQLPKPITQIPISQQTTQGEIEDTTQGETTQVHPNQPKTATAQMLRSMVTDMDDLHKEVAVLRECNKVPQAGVKATAQSLLPGPEHQVLSKGKQRAAVESDDEGVEEVEGIRSGSDDDDDDSDASFDSDVRRKELRAQLPSSMTEEQKDRAVAGPPRPSAAEKEAALQNLNRNSMNSISTQDLAPPFPSSGRVRSLTPTPPPERRHIQSSPAVRRQAKEKLRPQQVRNNGAAANTSSTRASLSRPPPSTAPATFQEQLRTPVATGSKTRGQGIDLARGSKNGGQGKNLRTNHTPFKNLHNAVPEPGSAAELRAELEQKHRDRERKAAADAATKAARERAAVKTARKQRSKEKKRIAIAAKAAKKDKAARLAAGEDVSSSSEESSDDGYDPIEDLSRLAREFAERNGASRAF